ncbi:hypothetical protein [Niallia taxi]|uniref:hypothetical protein n=1 Tax=Niallia taxi TaxID=2499688 RepID=UPI00300BF85F
MLRKLSSFLVIIWIVIYVLSAPIQFVASNIGLSSIIVILKALIPIILILFGIVNTLSKMEIGKQMATFLLILFLSICVAVLNNLNINQIAYGIKTFLPLLGLYSYMMIIKTVPDFKILFRLVSPIVILGVILDKFLTFPWTGQSYMVGNVERNISRSWETFGVERLSGFQSASYDTGIILTVFLMLYFLGDIIQKKAIKVTIFDGLLIILSIYAVYLTTFKSSYIFLVFYLILMVALHFYKNSVKAKPYLSVFIRYYMLFVFCYSSIPPVLSYLGYNFFVTNTNNFLLNFLFKSYSIRMTTTWPEAFSFLDLATFDGILGRGIGGIGTAQTYGELIYNAADNVFVYMIVTFGILSLPVLFWMLYIVFSKKMQFLPRVIMLKIFLLLLIYGATVSIVESPLVMSITGYLLALYLIKAKEGKIKDTSTLMRKIPANLQQG